MTNCLHYFVDVNSAGFHSLRLWSDKHKTNSTFVIPLSMDAEKSNADASRYVNNLNNPDAKLDFAGIFTRELNVTVPINPHKGKTIFEVATILNDAKFILWMHRKFDAADTRVGECWKAIDHLIKNRSPIIFGQTKPITVGEHLSEVGEEIDVKFIAKHWFSLAKTNSVKIIGVDQLGNSIYFIYKSKLTSSIVHMLSRKDVIPLNIKGIVKEHSIYKCIKQTMLSKVKFVDNFSHFGICLHIRHRKTTDEKLIISLKSYTPLNNDLIHSVELSRLITGAANDSGEIISRAFYLCKTYIPLMHADLKDILSNSLTQNTSTESFALVDVSLSTVTE